MNQHLAMVLASIGCKWPTAHEDAKYTAVLEKQLEFVKARTYDIVYPEMKARQMIPVNNDVDTGAETIAYRQWDDFGMAQIIANYGDDLPLIDALVEEFVQKVKGIGAAYQWSVQDLRRSAMANANLDQRRARAARRSETLRLGCRASPSTPMCRFWLRPLATGRLRPVSRWLRI